VVRRRIDVRLDPEHAEKLTRLAERAHVRGGTLARSLLSGALDAADPDVRDVAELLDRVDGAHERASLGRRQARAGRTISLHEL
jgi:hypothetical protein